MLFRGTLIAAASGKLNGDVFSHNRGGPYIRTHFIPTDPNTTAQGHVRDATSAAGDAWAGMTVEERQLWQDWARAHPRTNRIGDRHTHTGWNEYCRWAIPRLYLNSTFGAGISYLHNTPQGDEAKMPVSLAAHFEAANQFQVTFDNTDWWCNNEQNALLIYVCTAKTSPGVRLPHAMRPTINWYRGPYQLAGFKQGDTETPPTPSINIFLDTDALEGERIFWRAVLTTEDRGMSASYESATQYFP